jgi:hypothetical protein
MTIADLLVIFKARLSKFTCSVVDEDLTAESTAYLQYNSTSKNWVEFPPERIRIIGTGGIETYIYPTAYTVDRPTGIVTFGIARGATDIVRADYSKKPFSDAELTSILNSALTQVRVLAFHRIDAAAFSENYSEAIIKKAYTIALRELQFPTTKYFALSMGGRSIDKSSQVTQIEALITSNEADVLKDINVIRYFDRTNIIT